MTGIYFAGNFLSKSLGTRSAGEDLSEKLARRGWNVISASHYQNRFLRMADLLWTAWHFRRMYQAAVVEVYSGLAFRWAEVLCSFLRFIRKPYILTLHGGRLPEFAQKESRRIESFLAKAVAVTTPSKFLFKTFSPFRPSLAYLPNAIEITSYPYRTRINPQPELIWFRAFHSIYQPEIAVETLHLLLDTFPNAQLTMIGPDKGDGSRALVDKKVMEYSLKGQVLFTGLITKNQVGEALTKSDIFLNTTLYESFGVSVIEAAACGLCIVTTNVGELSYLWDDGIDALLVPPNDPDAMAAAVKRILTEPGLAEKLSHNARKKAEQFDWSNILPQWEKLFTDLLENTIS